MPSLVTIKLIGGIVGLLMLAGLILGLKHFKHIADDRGAQLAAICAAVRSAADNPKMDCKLVPQQVGELGKSIANLKEGIARQNAAVNALSAESDRQKAAAAQAVSKAQGRAQSAEATAERLKASSLSGAPSGAECEPSKALTEVWQ